MVRSADVRPWVLLATLLFRRGIMAETVKAQRISLLRLRYAEVISQRGPKPWGPSHMLVGLGASALDHAVGMVTDTALDGALAGPDAG